MNHDNHTSPIHRFARRALTIAALCIFTATATATWLQHTHANAAPTEHRLDGTDRAANDLHNAVNAADQTDARVAQSDADTEAPAADKYGLSGKININTASEDQLRMLPGIGPAKARRIIDYRSQRPFRRIQDLRRVKGIGYKTMKKLKPYLAVKGETTLRKE